MARPNRSHRAAVAVILIGLAILAGAAGALAGALAADDTHIERRYLNSEAGDR